MKKVVMLGLVMVFALTVTAAPVFAGEAGDKFCDGVKTFLTSPKNIPDSISEEYETAEFKPFGVVGGTVKGVVLTLFDAGKGLFSAVTSPLELLGE